MAPTIGIIATLLQQAIGVYGAYKGTAAAAKADASLQAALSVIRAFTPLVEGFGRGVEVTPEMVKKASESERAALAAFEAEIIKQGG